MHVSFGLLGEHLGHSFSPQIHEVLGSSPYKLVELSEADVIDYIRSDAWECGLNVTIPYKAHAAKAADVLGPEVIDLGVANTLYRAEEKIVARNTDVFGFGYMLEHFSQKNYAKPAGELLKNKLVLILGQGGAAQAVSYAVKQVGAEVIHITRKGPHTKESIATEFECAALIVNTTPVGMYPNCPDSFVDPATLKKLPRLLGVLDVVYNPRLTGICRIAETLGLPYESGLRMLVAQAHAASEFFQGKTLDKALIDQIVASILKQTTNIILIGMPGVGKTTTGAALARSLGRHFVDLDVQFEVTYDMSPAEYLQQFGEASFREKESEIAKHFAAQSGAVIACGGGIVERAQNYEYLHQNGSIFYLTRPIEGLSLEDRPISQKEGLEALAKRRSPRYESWADAVLSCTGSPKTDADAIISALDTLK